MVTVSAVGFMRYLMTTVVVGGTLGAAHGLSRTVHTPGSVLIDGIQGAVVGPWAPIAVPLIVTDVLPSDCPYLRRVLRDSGIFFNAKNLESK